MNWTGHTILITGGGSGIGEGLAAALHAAGNEVVIAGRRLEALQAVTDRHPGMAHMRLDQSDAGAVREFADEVLHRFPRLNVLVNNAGIVRSEDLREPDPETIGVVTSTNLLGPLLLTAHLLPALRSRSSAAIVNVSSALAFVPKADLPTYCATKAALHSYTESLRRRLRGGNVQVVEIAPPRVHTGTGPPDDSSVAVGTFVSEVMASLATHPEADEIVVPAARRLRFAERHGEYAEQFAAVNPERGVS